MNFFVILKKLKTYFACAHCDVPSVDIFYEMCCWSDARKLWKPINRFLHCNQATGQKLKHMMSETATKFQKFQGGQRGLSHPPKLVVSYNRAPRKKNCRIFTLMDFKAALGLISSRGLLVICSKYAQETHQPFWASSAIDHFSTVRWLGLCPTTYVKWFDYYLHHYSPWNHLRRNQLPN